MPVFFSPSEQNILLILDEVWKALIINVSGQTHWVAITYIMNPVRTKKKKKIQNNIASDEYIQSNFCSGIYEREIVSLPEANIPTKACRNIALHSIGRLYHGLGGG